MFLTGNYIYTVKSEDGFQPARRSPRIVRPREAFSGRDRVFGLKSGRAVSNRIAAAAKAAKLDGRFSGHSPRIGMAVDLVRAGIPTAAVQVAGRLGLRPHARVVGALVRAPSERHPDRTRASEMSPGTW